MCVSGVAGLCGPDSAPAKSLPPSLSILLFPLLSFPLYSPSLPLVIPASALLYYYFVVISIGWLSSERRFSLQRPKSRSQFHSRPCITYAKNYFPRYKRDNTARHFQTNTWTRIIGIRRNRFAIQGGRRGR